MHQLRKPQRKYIAVVSRSQIVTGAPMRPASVSCKSTSYFKLYYPKECIPPHYIYKTYEPDSRHTPVLMSIWSRLRWPQTFKNKTLWTRDSNDGLRLRSSEKTASKLLKKRMLKCQDSPIGRKHCRPLENDEDFVQKAPTPRRKLPHLYGSQWSRTFAMEHQCSPNSKNA